MSNDEQKKKTNFFDVIGKTRSETVHSNMLAWLLDSEEGHGLGTVFLEKFIKKCLECRDESSKESGTENKYTFDYPTDFSKFEVYTEEKKKKWSQRYCYQK